MGQFLLTFLVFLFIREEYALDVTPEADMNTVELIKQHGYDVSLGTVPAQSGYNLRLFHIPRGKGETPSMKKKPVVLLQHGLLDSSDSWVINSPEQSAAFIFADAGYDVWIGNMRGNKYSTSNPYQSPWWGFSFDEMAAYDLKQMIEGACRLAQVERLHYVGHSQGTLTMFLLSIRDPDFVKKRVKSIFALAPVLSVRNVEGFIPALAKAFYRPFAFLLYPDLAECEVFGRMMHDTPMSWITDKIPFLCDKLGGICEKVIESIMGPSNQTDPARLPIYTAHVPSGTSIRNLLHWAQAVRTEEGKLREFANPLDLGWWDKLWGNEKTMPEYDLSKISGDIHIYWSAIDYLATKKDIEDHLFPRLKEAGVYKADQIHELEGYNHVDFLWGTRAATDIYHPILKVMDKDKST